MLGILIVILFNYFNGSILNQNKIITWEKTFGGDSWDEFNSIISTSGGGYMAAGDTWSKGAGKADGWLLKLDSQGNKLWEKTYGGKNIDKIFSLIPTTNHNYTVAGYTESKGAGKADGWLLKLDSQGNKLWEKTYGGSNGDVFKSLIQTTDGGYAVAGYTYSCGAGHSDGWLLKLDSQGNKLWEKTYGGRMYDVVESLIQTPDGGYMAAIRTGAASAGDADGWLLKLDSQGNKLWEKTYGGNDWDSLTSLVYTLDDGYMIAGYTNSYGAGHSDGWLLKLDSQGNKLWEKTFGGSERDSFSSLISTSDAGFVLAGNTRSKGTGEANAWIIKLDSESNKLWERNYIINPSIWVGFILQTYDGGYVTAGWTSGPKGFGSADAWLLKLDERGNRK